MWKITPATDPPRTAIATHSAARASSASWWGPAPAEVRWLGVDETRVRRVRWLLEESAGLAATRG